MPVVRDSSSSDQPRAVLSFRSCLPKWAAGFPGMVISLPRSFAKCNRLRHPGYRCAAIGPGCGSAAARVSFPDRRKAMDDSAVASGDVGQLDDFQVIAERAQVAQAIAALT